MAKKKEDSSISRTVTFTEDEDSFICTEASKRSVSEEEYIKTAALNKPKKRYKDKLLKGDLTEATNATIQLQNHIMANEPTDVLMNDSLMIKGALTKAWQR